ncbi:hypothetical protein BDF20DRAFT_987028 [Mycotypha africana]|uniref:uncharacterized protein n=1 Tax=Mycotypha africana TaxID=64632 RepID=UPI002301ACCA|nr:uncharacterized protein BDF20DRAFT_987028 [Mycotypha africana]KAI8982068.1 hypothetical protein BDF20DRAFT_987028 [Mycotypha africana]
MLKMTSKTTLKNPPSPSSISDSMKLEQFRTQYELARNFYDDFEFCPLPYIDEVTKHREKIKQRLLQQQQSIANFKSSNDSGLPTRSHQRRSSKQLSNNQHLQNQYQQYRRSSNSSAMPFLVQPSKIKAMTSHIVASKAIPIIDPNSKAPVAVNQPAYCNSSNRSISYGKVSQPASSQSWATIADEGDPSSRSSSSSSSDSSGSPKSHSISFNGNDSFHYYNNNNTAVIANYENIQPTNFSSSNNYAAFENNEDNFFYSSITTNNYQTYYYPPASTNTKLYHQPSQEVAGSGVYQQPYQQYQRQVPLCNQYQYHFEGQKTSPNSKFSNVTVY